jgi:hypothetical protein
MSIATWLDLGPNRGMELNGKTLQMWPNRVRQSFEQWWRSRLEPNPMEPWTGETFDHPDVKKMSMLDLADLPFDRNSDQAFAGNPLSFGRDDS